MKQLYLGRLGQAMAKDCRPLSFSQHRRGLHTFFIPYLEPCPNIPQICWQILQKYFQNQARPNVLQICLEIFQNYLSKWGIKYVWELSTNTFKPEVLSKYFLHTIANSAEML